MPPGWIVGIEDHGVDDQPFQPYLETTAEPVRRVYIGGRCRTREGADAQAERFLANCDDTFFFDLEERVRSLNWDARRPDDRIT